MRRRIIECPCCQGAGEIEKKSRKFRKMLNPPMEVCYYCKGSGRVPEEDDPRCSKDFQTIWRSDFE